MSRKLLNIFLRDCFYNAYLAKAYGLQNAEEFYEVPLDSITAQQLKKRAERGQLPVWPGVKHLSPEESDRFQAFAREVAGNAGVAPVHLDALWWSRPDELGKAAASLD